MRLSMLLSVLIPIWGDYFNAVWNLTLQGTKTDYIETAYVSLFRGHVNFISLYHPSDKYADLLLFMENSDLPPFSEYKAHMQSLQEYLLTHFKDDEDIQRMGF